MDERSEGLFQRTEIHGFVKNEWKIDEKVGEAQVKHCQCILKTEFKPEKHYSYCYEFWSSGSLKFVRVEGRHLGPLLRCRPR